MNEYFINYAQSNIMCAIIFGIMLARDRMGVDRQEKQIKYDHALIAFMLYFISDAIWSAVVADVIEKNRVSVVATNFANYFLLAAVTYMWLRYVMAVEQVPHRERPINKVAVLFPFFVSTVALIATYCFVPYTLIDESLEVRPAFNAFLAFVPAVYIVAVVFYALRRWRQELNPLEKRRHLYIGLFPLIVIAGGLLQIVLLPNTPIFCFSCTILMLIFFIQAMETQISVDPLTGLNNRGQLIHYASQENSVRREGRETFVVMIDVNDFKQINDTYGHSEGDRALTIVASSIKKVAKGHTTPTFLGRYGGDEFVLIVHPYEESELFPLLGEIREEIRAACAAAETAYVLSVGIGYDKLTGESDTFQKCMQRADRKLYLDKEYCKTHGQTTICG